jgi:hypothetical protein
MSYDATRDGSSRMNACGKRPQSAADDAAKRLREDADLDTGFTSTGKAAVCAASSMNSAVARATAAFAATLQDQVPIAAAKVPATVVIANRISAVGVSKTRYMKRLQKQKNRAINLWEECRVENSQLVDTTVWGRVRSELENGIVSPIYHAVVRGCNPFGCRSSVPSDMDVSAGTTIGAKGAMVSDLDMVGTFKDSFFTGMDANSKVIDETSLSVIWHLDSVKAKHVASLVNAKAMMIGEDVEVTEDLPSSFYIDAEAKKNNLLTRCLSRGVVARCFSEFTTGTTLAITGKTGIGKSWTLLYVLQQALLYANACVVFFNQKWGKAFLCMRKLDQIFVWSAYTSRCVFSRWFEEKHVLVLVEPQAGGADFVNCAGKLIYLSSNQHVGWDVSPLYLDPWTKKEFIIGHSMMEATTSLEEALKRAESAGMLPRYLVKNERVYCYWVDRIEEHINEASAAKWTTWSSLPETLTVVQAAFEGTDDYDGLRGTNYSKKWFYPVHESVENRLRVLRGW